MSWNGQILRNFFVFQGAFPQEYWRYFKGKQRGKAEKTAIDGRFNLV